MRSVFIVGCGYVGVRLAERWRALGRSIRGSTSRAHRLTEIAAAGALGVPLDLDSPLPPIDCTEELVYYLVPPAPQGARDARLARFLEHLTGPAARIVYMSTTGVYGDRDGALVNEDTPPAPVSDRAIRRLAAEAALRAWSEARRISWCILRVPGIYGPGRLPLERLRRGEPAIAPEEAPPGSRIHVEDLVTACVAAGTSGRAHARIYNVTDGSEDSLTAYLQRVARIGRLPPPPLIGREEARARLSASSWSFFAESRRVDNRRLREELGVALAYQDLDEGIRASLQSLPNGAASDA